MQKSVKQNPSQQLLTTHGAARLLGVDPSTVAAWCDKRGLASWRTAGNHRRIAQEDLLAFAQAWQIPLRTTQAA
jgi:excisionase family DNA binding protein